MTDQHDPVAALLAGARQFAESADEKTGRDVLVAGAKQFLADLDDDQFTNLVAEVRPPADQPATDGPAYPPGWGYQRENGDH